MKESDKTWDMDETAFLLWLENLRDSLGHASWKYYRASLVYVFDEIEHPRLPAHIAEISTSLCKDAYRTSNKKKKSVSDDDVMALTKALVVQHSSANENIWGVPTLEFLLSGIITGLRPTEWFSAELSGGHPHFRITIKNAKATQGRAHGEFRSFKLQGLSGAESRLLVSHYERCKAFTNRQDYDKFVVACSDKLYRTGKALWPKRRKRPTLYSGRHQSIANVKKDDTLLKINAALHGHATDRTAAEHYGQRKDGYAGRVVKIPDASDVSRVREVPKNWTPPDRSTTRNDPSMS